MTEFNLVPNPRFHVGTDGWEITDYSKWGPAELPTRVTSVPFGALPAGADACGLLDMAGGSPAVCILEELASIDDALDVTLQFAAQTPDAEATECVCICDVKFYGTGWSNYLGHVLLSDRTVGYALDAWHVLDASTAIPAGATFGVLAVDVYPYDVEGLHGFYPNYNYFTLVRAGGSVVDTYGANVLINGGACVVFEPDVTLTLNPGSVAATEMAIRNDEDGYGAWEAFAATKAWTLSAAAKVWAKFRDSA